MNSVKIRTEIERLINGYLSSTSTILQAESGYFKSMSKTIQLFLVSIPSFFIFYVKKLIGCTVG